MSDRPWDSASLPEPLIAFERTFECFLDLTWIELRPDSAQVRFVVRDDLKQPLGLLHGGIYCSVAETIASVATVHEVWKDGFIGSGLNNSASFVRPITGGAVDVVAQLRHRGDTEWLWSHTFRDEQERICALVDVTIAVRPIRS
jgi:1,4-dihydroxy-2-naphthoyl-CoA hydrolase